MCVNVTKVVQGHRKLPLVQRLYRAYQAPLYLENGKLYEKKSLGYEGAMLRFVVGLKAEVGVRAAQMHRKTPKMGVFGENDHTE